MKDIAILTATYNHPKELAELYASLLGQRDGEFTWIVVDDGSAPETGELLRRIEGEGRLDILAVSQPNGGKSRAVNRGLDAMSDEVRAVVIVDDDENLRPDAVETVRRYADKYAGTDCGVIHFTRLDEKGRPMADPEIREDFFMSYQEFKSRGWFVDGYVCYLTDKLGDQRFHIYEGEKYIGPSTLFMRVSRNCRILWSAAVLGDTEYLAGGITKQGRKLRANNPRGMIEYCSLMQENGSSLKNRLAYSVHGYAYMQFLDKKDRPKDTPFLPAARLPGRLLARRWKKRFNSR